MVAKKVMLHLSDGWTRSSLLQLRGLPAASTLDRRSMMMMNLLNVKHEVALLLEGLVALLAPEGRRRVHDFRRCGHDRLLRLVVERVLLLVEELGRDLVRLLLRLLYM